MFMCRIIQPKMYRRSIDKWRCCWKCQWLEVPWCSLRWRTARHGGGSMQVDASAYCSKPTLSNWSTAIHIVDPNDWAGYTFVVQGSGFQPTGPSLSQFCCREIRYLNLEPNKVPGLNLLTRNESTWCFSNRRLQVINFCVTELCIYWYTSMMSTRRIVDKKNQNTHIWGPSNNQWKVSHNQGVF